MPLITVPTGSTSAAAAIKELQGLTTTVIDGAAAGTAMNVPALRLEDTIVSAVVFADAGGAPTDDKANITIQPTAASATVTFTAGNPTEGESISVNGNVYLYTATPKRINEMPLSVSVAATKAAAFAAAVNAYENRYESQLNGDANRTAGVKATVNGAVVTITSVKDGAGNAPVVTGTVTVLVAAGSGTGVATLTAATVVADNTFVLAGITFTAKATPVGDVQFAVKANNTDQAKEIARVINAYALKYGTDAKASAAAAVVTITPRGVPSGNAIALTESTTTTTATGSGWLTGGTNTGSIKSTTNHATNTIVLTWFNKR